MPRMKKTGNDSIRTLAKRWETAANREREQWEAHFTEKNGARVSESESAFDISDRGLESREASVKGGPQIVIHDMGESFHR